MDEDRNGGTTWRGSTFLRIETTALPPKALFIVVAESLLRGSGLGVFAPTITSFPAPLPQQVPKKRLGLRRDIVGTSWIWADEDGKVPAGPPCGVDAGDPPGVIGLGELGLWR